MLRVTVLVRYTHELHWMYTGDVQLHVQDQIRICTSIEMTWNEPKGFL